jgi:hypothetical protein
MLHRSLGVLAEFPTVFVLFARNDLEAIEDCKAFRVGKSCV